MESILLNYLEKIDKYLEPLAAAERADIINEIKSEMLELEAKDKLTSAQIVERLGNPKELAKAYLGQSITQNNGFNIRKLGTVIVFCGAIVPICGAVKFLGALVGIDLPIIMFQFGSYTASLVMAFPLSIIIGILLFLAGSFLWKLTIQYIQMLSSKKKQL